jgi:hypothetical protein
MSLSFRANVLSTLVGVPLATCLNPVPMWLVELKASGIASVALDLLFLASLTLPLYFVSVVTEAFVARRFLDKDHRRYAWRWAWLANLASYAVIPAGLAILALIVWLTE